MGLKILNFCDYLIISSEMFFSHNLIDGALYALYNIENLTNESRKFKFIILKSTLNYKISKEYFNLFSKLPNTKLLDLSEEKIIEKLISNNSNVHIFVVVPHSIDAENRFLKQIYLKPNVKIGKIFNNQLVTYQKNNQNVTNNNVKINANITNGFKATKNINNINNINVKKTVNLFKFKIYNGTFNTNKSLLGHKEVKEGDTVYDSNANRINLIKKLGAGGEGTVYLGSNQKAIKIIKSDKLTVSYKDRIEFMAKNIISRKNPNKLAKYICWPQEAIYDKNNNFVGYSMECVNSITLYEIMQQNEKDTNSYGIFNFTKTDIVNIIIRILEMFEYLHSMNIIVGDIKLENIVFRLDNNGRPNLNEIYFVDADSYQVDKFPATAVSPGYIAPELKSNEYRTIAEDNFAIFSLIFMILFKGIKPYQQIKLARDNSSYDDDVAKGNFPYSNNEQVTQNRIPKGYPFYCWSHLPIYIRNAFISVGWVNGHKYAPNKRLSSSDWLKLFRIYRKHLCDGTLSRIDKNYNVGIYKITNGTNYYIRFDQLDISTNGNVNILKKNK